jgi:hypothetical protein
VAAIVLAEPGHETVLDARMIADPDDSSLLVMRRGLADFVEEVQPVIELNLGRRIQNWEILKKRVYLSTGEGGIDRRVNTRWSRRRRGRFYDPPTRPITSCLLARARSAGPVRHRRHD